MRNCSPTSQFLLQRLQLDQGFQPETKCEREKVLRKMETVVAILIQRQILELLVRIWNFTQFRFGGQMLHHWTTESCAKCLGHMWNAPRKLIRSAIFWSKQHSVRTAEVLFVAKDSNVFSCLTLPHKVFAEKVYVQYIRSFYFILKKICFCGPFAIHVFQEWTEENWSEPKNESVFINTTK